MFGCQTFMFEPTLSLFSRYVSTVGFKRRYHSPRVCVDVAGRDSCRVNKIGCWLFIYWWSEDLKEQFSLSRNRFLRRTPTSQDRFALRQLLWPDFSTCFYRLLCVIGSDMNYPPSLKLHEATLSDQWGGVLKVTTQYDTEPRIDWK